MELDLSKFFSKEKKSYIFKPLELQVNNTMNPNISNNNRLGKPLDYWLGPVRALTNAMQWMMGLIPVREKKRLEHF